MVKITSSSTTAATTTTTTTASARKSMMAVRNVLLRLLFSSSRGSVIITLLGFVAVTYYQTVWWFPALEGTTTTTTTTTSSSSRTTTTTTTTNGVTKVATDTTVERQQQLLPDRDLDAFDPYRCIVLISMGKEAMESNLVERFVYSARYRGQYRGYVVLLTDAPPSRYASSPYIEDQEHFIVMNPVNGHLNTTFGEDMPYKRFKTYVVDYIDMLPQLQNVQLIYYLDVDIIVGNSLPKMFVELERQYNIPSPEGEPKQSNNMMTLRTTTTTTPTDKWLEDVPKIWFFKNKYKHMTVQGGQFILHRQTSRGCLDFWRYQIDSNVTEVKDQPALQKMKSHQDDLIEQYEWRQKHKLLSWLTSPPPVPKPNCVIRRMSWEKYLYFPANSTVYREADQIRNRKSVKLPTLVHFKNSCNTTSQIDDDAETTYIEYVLRNKDLAQKIHIKPDGYHDLPKR
jgi:hypothetical protein